MRRLMMICLSALTASTACLGILFLYALVAPTNPLPTAAVTSAHPLTNEQVATLKTQLKARVGRDVSVDLTVDPAILGGLVVRIGSQMIDSSIRTRLNTLAHAMKG